MKKVWKNFELLLWHQQQWSIHTFTLNWFIHTKHTCDCDGRWDNLPFLTQTETVWWEPSHLESSWAATCLKFLQQLNSTYQSSECCCCNHWFKLLNLGLASTFPHLKFKNRQWWNRKVGDFCVKDTHSKKIFQKPNSTCASCLAAAGFECCCASAMLHLLFVAMSVKLTFPETNPSSHCCYFHAETDVISWIDVLLRVSRLPEVWLGFWGFIILTRPFRTRHQARKSSCQIICRQCLLVMPLLLNSVGLWFFEDNVLLVLKRVLAHELQRRWNFHSFDLVRLCSTN